MIDFFQGEKAGELHNGHPVFLLILKELKVKFEVNSLPILNYTITQGFDTIGV